MCKLNEKELTTLKEKYDNSLREERIAMVKTLALIGANVQFNNYLYKYTLSSTGRNYFNYIEKEITNLFGKFDINEFYEYKDLLKNIKNVEPLYRDDLIKKINYVMLND